jgi:hypothetical protein
MAHGDDAVAGGCVRFNRRGSRNARRHLPEARQEDLACVVLHLQRDRRSMRAADFGDVSLLPAGAGLEPEDGGDDGLPAFACGLAIEVFCHLGVGLHVAVVEFAAIVLPQRLRRHADYAGDVGFRHTVAGHGFDLTADARIGLVSEAGHLSVRTDQRAGRAHRAPKPRA